LNEYDVYVKILFIFRTLEDVAAKEDLSQIHTTLTGDQAFKEYVTAPYVALMIVFEAVRLDRAVFNYIKRDGYLLKSLRFINNARC
jgi:hypothetical protein